MMFVMIQSITNIISSQQSVDGVRKDKVVMHLNRRLRTFAC